VGNLHAQRFNGPAFFNWDPRHHQGFPDQTESKKLGIRVEMFNAPKPPNLCMSEIPPFSSRIQEPALGHVLNDPNFGCRHQHELPTPRVIQDGAALPILSGGI